MQIYITRRLPEPVQTIIESTEGLIAKTNPYDRPLRHDELLEELSECHILICHIQDSIDKDTLDRAPLLKMVGTFSVGFNHIDIEECRKRKIPVINTQDVLADATADLGFALMMATARRLVEADAFVRAGKWMGAGPTQYLGRPIYGATIGIIGMGSIGTAVAQRALGFKMKILYHNRHESPRAKQLDAELVGLEELLGRSDFVILCCPLVPETVHIISAPQLKLMRPTSVLINIARGPCVKEDDLIEALLSHTIYAAGLDVYEHEPHIDPRLFELPNVVLLPHIGSATEECRNEMGMILVRAVEKLKRGESLDDMSLC